MTERCVQCGWTIANGRQEDIRDKNNETIPLHRGGCPDHDMKERNDHRNQ